MISLARLGEHFFLGIVRTKDPLSHINKIWAGPQDGKEKTEMLITNDQYQVNQMEVNTVPYENVSSF